MKKVLAMLLAAAMATTMAFAANDITIGAWQDTGAGTGDNGLYPGETYTVSLFNEVQLDNWVVGTNDIKSISVKWNEGSALVDSLKLVDKNSAAASLELNLKENYTIYEARSLEGVVTVKYEDGTSEKFTLSADVGNDYETIVTEKRSDDAEEIIPLDNTVYEADGTGYVKAISEDGLLEATLRLKDGSRYFLYMEEDADALDTIYDEYDEAADEAYVHTYEYIAHPSVANAVLTLQADYKDQYYIYELNGTKLKEVKTTWNKEDGQYEWETNTLGAYVISDVELVASEDDTTDETNDGSTTVEENPSTGANDFVGLAVALAVVSVAGIAVAKRK